MELHLFYTIYIAFLIIISPVRCFLRFYIMIQNISWCLTRSAKKQNGSHLLPFFFLRILTPGSPPSLRFLQWPLCNRCFLTLCLQYIYPLYRNIIIWLKNALNGVTGAMFVTNNMIIRKRIIFKDISSVFFFLKDGFNLTKIEKVMIFLNKFGCINVFYKRDIVQ